MTRADRRFVVWSLGACCVVTAGLLTTLNLYDRGVSIAGAATRPKLGETFTQRISNSRASFDLVYVPGGTFWMGSPPIEKGRDETDHPRHQVTVGPFWMGKHEVTADLVWVWFREWQQKRSGQPGYGDRPISAAGKRAAGLVPCDYPYYPIHRGDERSQPALTLTAYGAQQFCRWLTVRTGRYYRLPTEAEWEFACRAGSETAYPFGDDSNRLSEYVSLESDASVVQSVGLKKPNAFGLYDMLGNVGEFVLDDWDGPYFKPPQSGAVPIDPWRPNRDRHYFTVRGGDAASEPSQLRSAARRRHVIYGQEPNDSGLMFNGDVPVAGRTGFRVVSPLAAPPAEDLRDRSIPAPKYEYWTGDR